MTVLEAMLRSTSTNAIKGKTQAFTQIAKMLKDIVGKDQENNAELVRLAAERKEWWSNYLRKQKRKGENYTWPVPHPHHIQIDWETMTVTITGPIDQDELYQWKCLIVLMLKAEIEIQQADDDGLDDEHSDIGIQRDFLEKAQDTIPSDDPVWLEFASRYRRAIIDERFYYGPPAKLLRQAHERPKSLKKKVREARPEASPEVRRAARRLTADCLDTNDEFRAFMRAKLREQMGEEAWVARFERRYHEPRDIEYDRIRWEYERGVFDPDNFEFTEEDKEELRNPEALETYMAW